MPSGGGGGLGVAFGTDALNLTSKATDLSKLLKIIFKKALPINMSRHDKTSR